MSHTSRGASIPLSVVACVLAWTILDVSCHDGQVVPSQAKPSHRATLRPFDPQSRFADSVSTCCCHALMYQMAATASCDTHTQKPKKSKKTHKWRFQRNLFRTRSFATKIRATIVL